MARPRPRVVLAHTRREEGASRRDALTAGGLEVELEAGDLSAASFHKYRSATPSVFVVDLSRLPSEGRAIGIWLRQQSAFRTVPLVFAGGKPDKVAATRRVLPDAAYCTWRRAPSAVRRAMREPPENPVVPDTMAGYSGTPLVEKLGIRPDSTVALLSAPPDFDLALGLLPEGVRTRRQARGTADKVLLFVRRIRDLERRFPAAVRMLGDGGGLWLAWPKKSSGVATDLTQAVVRQHGLERGWVDYKICAIDATWSGLLFSRRCQSPKGHVK